MMLKSDYNGMAIENATSAKVWRAVMKLISLTNAKRDDAKLAFVTFLFVSEVYIVITCQWLLCQPFSRDLPSRAMPADSLGSKLVYLVG